MSRAFRLGAFIVVTLLIFAAGVFWIGGKEFLFSPTYRLNADFQTVAGLPNGAGQTPLSLMQARPNETATPPQRLQQR